MFNSTSLRSKTVVIGFLLAIGTLGFHLINLDYASYDLDEAVHIWHAQKSYSEVIVQASNDPNPPIYNLIISAWVKQFGVSEISTRSFSVLMGVFGTILLYIIGTRNFGLFIGLTAAIFYALSPIQFRFTHLARPYSMLLVAVLLSYGLLFEILKRRSNWKLIGYLLSTGLMIYVHPTSVFNVPAQILIILVHKRNDLISALALSTVPVLATLSFLVWVFSIPYFERNDSMWFDAPNWDAVWYVLKVFNANQWIIILQLVLLTVMVIFMVKRKSQYNVVDLVTVLIWIIVPFGLSILVSHAFKPVFQDKYILTVQPALMLLLALGIGQFKSLVLRSVCASLVIGLLMTSTDLTLRPEGDWKNAVSYVKVRQDSSSAVFISPWYEFRTFSYYYDQHMYEVPDSTVKLLAANRVTFAWHDVYDSDKQRFKCSKLHILTSHEGYAVSSVDEALLDSTAHLTEEKKFAGIRLRTFEIPEGYSIN